MAGRAVKLLHTMCNQGLASEKSHSETNNGAQHVFGPNKLWPGHITLQDAEAGMALLFGHW